MLIPFLFFIPTQFLAWVFFRVNLGIMREATLVGESGLTTDFTLRVLAGLGAATGLLLLKMLGIFLLGIVVLRWLSLPLCRGEALLQAAQAKRELPPPQSSIFLVDKKFDQLLRDFVSGAKVSALVTSDTWGRIKSFVAVIAVMGPALWILFAAIDIFLSELMQSLLNQMLGISFVRNGSIETIRYQIELMEKLNQFVFPFMALAIIWRVTYLVRFRDQVLLVISEGLATAKFPLHLRKEHFFHEFVAKLNQLWPQVRAKV